ncbi:hypothetical protein ABOM_003998 [Aspergillus bombycis]|uniref:NADP-dependent oxidoreductase domain-containing protein n=1 Tax=Aspergillus bombycis TaxID=109264 RepID=A0A1F8A5W7_9EURO|nr:hypothetical protein ABOM_003998 [Aspergillus bombycis]OGM47160.1 hypothetical protein ABOM_003998 [Aspergillus bombycis]
MAPAEHPQVVFGTASFGTGSPQAKFYDEATASPILTTLQARNITVLDTARAYPVGSPGTSEKILGQLRVPSWATVSTKVLSWKPGSHQADRVKESITASLEALQTDQVDILYLHAPDRATPFEETCRAIDAEYRARKFARFGLSNYTAEEVEEIVTICEKHGLVKPSVYQGRYNAIIRSAEAQLFPVLRRHGIAFYAYSPAAAGLFTGKVSPESTLPGSRWDKNWARAGLTLDDLPFGLKHQYGDSVIIGASSLAQLEANLDAVEAGPLSEHLAGLVDQVGKLVGDEAAPYHL